MEGHKKDLGVSAPEAPWSAGLDRFVAKVPCLRMGVRHCDFGWLFVIVIEHVASNRTRLHL